MESKTHKKQDRVIFKAFILLALALTLAGCGSVGNSDNAAASGKTYAVSADLLTFYNQLDGESLFGPAISKLLDNPSGQCQYTVNALICLNPLQSGSERYFLSPLGNNLNLRETPAQSDASGSLVINGYTVYEEFVLLYEQLSGATYAGNPISQVHLNYAQERIEQFFENVGFYRNFNDPPGRVKLLAYGAASCTKECRYHPADAASLLNQTQSISGQSLLDGLNNVSDTAAFGEPLTQPYLAADGNEEQVFSNVVLYRDVTNGVVRLRPLAALLGMLTTEPGVKQFGQENGMVFYALKDGLGYHVPVLFDQFISAHGGSSLSGDPIAEVIEYQPGILRQCFTNYCLDYSSQARKDQQVIMAALGNQYLQLQQNTVVTQPAAEPLPQTISLQVSELYNPLPVTEAQQIAIVILNVADQQPLPGLEAELVVNLPDGNTFAAAFPATQTDGRSSITLPVMKKTPNGSILTWQVCVNNVGVETVCQTGSYLVWTNP